MGCCSWTSSRNIRGRCSKPFASRSRPAKSWWPAPTRMSAIPAASCWSPPPTPANAAIFRIPRAPAPACPNAEKIIWAASRAPSWTASNTGSTHRRWLFRTSRRQAAGSARLTLRRGSLRHGIGRRRGSRDTARSGSTPTSSARCSTRWQAPIRADGSYSTRWPCASASRHAATTGSCASPAPLPISPAPTRSAGRMWRKLSVFVWQRWRLEPARDEGGGPDKCVPRLRNPSVEDLPDVRRVVPEIDLDAAPRRPEPLRDPKRVVEQDLAPAGLQIDGRRVREVREQRRGARVPRIGPGKHHLDEVAEPGRRQDHVARRVRIDRVARPGEIRPGRKGVDPGGRRAAAAEFGQKRERQSATRAVAAKHDPSGRAAFRDEGIPDGDHVLEGGRKWRLGHEAVVRGDDRYAGERGEPSKHPLVGLGAADDVAAAVEMEDGAVGARFGPGEARDVDGSRRAGDLPHDRRRVAPAEEESGGESEIPLGLLRRPGAAEKRFGACAQDRVEEDELPAHQARLASIASQILAVTFTPSNRSSSCKPVGEVTLISVSQSPITSMPTKIWPFSRRTGAIRAQISRSRSLRPIFSGRPPTCMFDRVSPAAGTRVIAPTGSPSTRMIRLSPFETSGRNCWAINGSRESEAKSSCRLARLRSLGSSRKTPAPPLP